MGGQPTKLRNKRVNRFDNGHPSPNAFESSVWSTSLDPDRKSLATFPSPRPGGQSRHFVALYQWPNGPNCSFDPGSQITLSKGDRLIFYGRSADNEWSDVKNSRTCERGWVPSNYIRESAPKHNASSSLVSSTFRSNTHESIKNEKWYHGAIERSYAEFMLNSGITGSFLVRDSEGSPGNYTISVRYNANISHFRISSLGNQQFYINEQNKFPSVAQLVEHLKKNMDGLPCLLLYPVAKDYDDGQFDMSDTLVDGWEIDRKEIIMKHKLGSGQYGVVYEALWTKCNATVAVKTVKEDITIRDEFLEEAQLMKTLKHQNLVQLLGVCTREPPYYIITEFMCNGNLLDYLRNNPQEELPPPILLQMATDVAKGMTYLENCNFIHRDLAARNCLVAQHHLVKVADFGLARCMECDDTYQAKEGAKFPIKWTAPEGLVYNRFSIKSDVWAYGVLLWEIATYGKTPYPGLELSDVYPLLEKGKRMDPPKGCPKHVNSIMQRCWQWQPEQRPSFKTILAELSEIQDIGNEVARELEQIDVNDEHELVSSTTQHLHIDTLPIEDFDDDEDLPLPAPPGMPAPPRPLPPRRSTSCEQILNQELDQTQQQRLTNGAASPRSIDSPQNDLIPVAPSTPGGPSVTSLAAQFGSRRNAPRRATQEPLLPFDDDHLPPPLSPGCVSLQQSHAANSQATAAHGKTMPVNHGHLPAPPIHRHASSVDSTRSASNYSKTMLSDSPGSLTSASDEDLLNAIGHNYELDDEFPANSSDSLSRQQMKRLPAPQPPRRTTPVKQSSVPPRPATGPARKPEEEEAPPKSLGSSLTAFFGRKRPQGPGKTAPTSIKPLDEEPLAACMTTSSLYPCNDSPEVDAFFNLRTCSASVAGNKSARSSSGDELVAPGPTSHANSMMRPVSMIGSSDLYKSPSLRNKQAPSSLVKTPDTPKAPFVPRDFHNELKQRLCKQQQQLVEREQGEVGVQPTIMIGSSASQESVAGVSTAPSTVGCFTLPRKRSLRLPKNGNPNAPMPSAIEPSHNHQSTCSNDPLQGLKLNLRNKGLSKSQPHQNGESPTTVAGTANKEMLDFPGSKMNKRKSWTAGSLGGSVNTLGSSTSSGYSSSGGGSSMTQSGASPYSTTGQATRLPTLMSSSSTKLDQLSTVMTVSTLLKILSEFSGDLQVLLAKSSTHQLTNDQATLIADRLDQCRLGCISFVDNVECKAVAKFKFRDQCGQLQSMQNELSSGGGAPAKLLDGLRKAHATIESLIDAAHRLADENPSSGVSR